MILFYILFAKFRSEGKWNALASVSPAECRHTSAFSIQLYLPSQQRNPLAVWHKMQHLCGWKTKYTSTLRLLRAAFQLNERKLNSCWNAVAMAGAARAEEVGRMVVLCSLCRQSSLHGVLVALRGRDSKGGGLNRGGGPADERL